MELERERNWLANNQDRLAGELEAEKRRNAELEQQVDLSRSSPTKVEQDLVQALQPEIARGTISVYQSGEVLMISLISNLLFDSTQDQLKTGGAVALKRVGCVLKNFPEKEVSVAKYTANVVITGALQKKFPSNRELSDARAKSAAQVLREGGVSSHVLTLGHGDNNPVASNGTAAGRAKNRRVEIIVS